MENRKAIFRLDEDVKPYTLTGQNLTGGELENGAFVEVGGLIGDALDRQTHELKKLSGNENAVIGFVSDPCLFADETKTEWDFVCPQGDLIRTYIPNESTQPTYALKHFENKGEGLVKDDYLSVLPNSTQLKKMAEGEKAVAQVLAREDFEGQESLFIRFIK